MSAGTGCFYLPLGEERFRAAGVTASPWGCGSEHGGPPAALLGRALASDAGGEGGIFARLAFEILGPIPVGELSVEAKTVRPGRRISLREATLAAGQGARRRGLRKRCGRRAGHLRVDVYQPRDHGSPACLPRRRVGRPRV